jgi:hypothetical protein
MRKLALMLLLCTMSQSCVHTAGSVRASFLGAELMCEWVSSPKTTERSLRCEPANKEVDDASSK